ncbi:MAG: hypothetical protein ACI3XZ_09685 [Butyricicoccus sp.]
MKHSLFVAYGGILTALSIVLLVLASVSPGSGWGLCISAGMLPAIPLAHRQVRLGIHVYLVTALLALLIVPGKRFAIGYTMLFGVYPLVKYVIERLHCLPLEWLCKLAYAGCIEGFLLYLLRLGMISLTGHAAEMPHGALTLAFLTAFVCYDILFSKIIALFRVLFRDR